MVPVPPSPSFRDLTINPRNPWRPGKRAKAKRSRTAKPASKAKASKPKAKTGTLAQTFMKELDAELAVTRRCVERMPSDLGEFKPHPRSAPMGRLTQLICKMVGVLANIPMGIDLDLKSGPGYSFEQTATLLTEFDKNAKACGLPWAA